MALFKSYAVIYLAIGAAIYEVLFVFYSYPNDDTETVIFDHPIHASYCWLCCITVVRAQLNPSEAFMTGLNMASVTHVGKR